MNTSVATITPQTAPRSFEELSKVGIFQLRLLIEKLGGNATAEAKQAFAAMKAEEKANYAMQLLQAWDRQNGGAPQQQVAPQFQQPQMTAAPPQMMMGQQQPHMNGQNGVPMQGYPVAQGSPIGGGAPPAMAPQFAVAPQYPQQMSLMPAPSGAVSQVDPSAIAAAGAATQPTASGRKPRAVKAESSDSELGAQVLSMLSHVGGLVQQLLGEVNTMKGEISTVHQKMAEIAGSNGALAEQYKGVYQVLSSWDGRITALQNGSHLNTAVLLLLSENNLGAGRQDILQAAFGEIPAVAALFQATAAPGKQ